MLEKITAEQLVAKGVVSAPDKLKGNPRDNKYVFDCLVAEVVAPVVNACIDTVNGVEMQESTIKKNEEQRKAAEDERQAAEEERQNLESGYVTRAETAAEAAEEAAGNAAASQVAAKASETAAEDAARRAAQVVLGQIPDGSITAAKLATGAAAPAGYGLGENAVQAPSNGDVYTDADLIDKTGFFRALDIPGFAGGWAYVDHVQYNSRSFKQEITHATYGYRARRIKSGGVIQPIEWYTPPMYLGVEYRTTERYRGKPVYVKAIDCGAILQGKKAIGHGIQNVAMCIAAIGTALQNSSTYTFSFPYWYNDESKTITQGISVTVNQYNVTLSSFNDLEDEFTAVVNIKYTKTTD